MSVSALCQRCGLCCNGSLFTFLPLSEGERAALLAKGARVEQRRDGRWALLLPCAVLEGTCCGAYAERPKRCGEYFCELAKAVEKQERTFESALTVVDEAKAQLQALKSRLGPAEPNEVRSVLQRALQAEAKEPFDRHFEALRQAAREVEAMLKQYFVGPY